MSHPRRFLQFSLRSLLLVTFVGIVVGQTYRIVVYDQRGQLKFAGGVTAGRGHGGENQGAAAVAALLRGKPANCQSHPVYGCPITRSASDTVRTIQ